MRVPGHIARAVMAVLLGLIVSSQALGLPTGDIEDEPESEWYILASVFQISDLLFYRRKVQ